MNKEIEILKFGSENCQPCVAYSPIIEWWAKWKVTLTSVDVDKEPSMASNYRVMSIPVTILLSNGLEVNRWPWPMTVNQLDDFIW